MSNEIITLNDRFVIDYFDLKHYSTDRNFTEYITRQIKQSFADYVFKNFDSLPIEAWCEKDKVIPAINYYSELNIISHQRLKELLDAERQLKDLERRPE